ncbi:hypothetical protein KO528_14820 [Saccharophagus degradans]|uniref:Uncharacterized protein n=1 Tax=Saccharophagus degradans TaxID=86304 RepID=A0AAW7XB33_9GAMM|nr:hypothetical protein [Saccharophagus degradans]MBU2986634.1 hypothetical protein [Saccharophagus degradans]MDO6424754.1 hypothetical protein [Saccharophagus degradans]MDO6609494.1 hypothetical protein [Saccharophagus degradans]
MKNINKSLISMVAGAVLLFAGVTEARTWEFKNGPREGGWVWDKTVPGSFPGQLGSISFKNSSKYVTTRRDGKNDKVLVVKSGDRKYGPMEGGGIERANTFNTNNMEARCRMVGNTEQVRRSQASFWQDTAGPNSTEIDVFEVKPGGNFLNFLSWRNGIRVKLTENGSESHKWTSINAARNWSNFKCTTSNRNNFSCTRNGGSKKTWTKLNGSTVGNTVIIHNKPWRINQSNLSVGPVASLECDWVKN